MDGYKFYINFMQTKELLNMFNIISCLFQMP